jgi:hypothetical protein
MSQTWLSWVPTGGPVRSTMLPWLTAGDRFAFEFPGVGCRPPDPPASQGAAALPAQGVRGAAIPRVAGGPGGGSPPGKLLHFSFKPDGGCIAHGALANRTQPRVQPGIVAFGWFWKPMPMRPLWIRSSGADRQESRFQASARNLSQGCWGNTSRKSSSLGVEVASCLAETLQEGCAKLPTVFTYLRLVPHFKF